MKEIADECRAALYHATKDVKYLQEFQEQIAKGEKTDLMTISYLARQLPDDDFVRNLNETAHKADEEATRKKREEEEYGVDNWQPKEHHLKVEIFIQLPNLANTYFLFQAIEEKQDANLAHERIRELPASFFDHVSIKHLGLCDNRLRELPAQLSKLVNLTDLNLQANRLTGPLADVFGNLTNLTTLGFHANSITELPESFCQLVNLKELTLSHNKLTVLPESFGNLVSLKSIYLDHNELLCLPASFTKLVNLEVSASTFFLIELLQITFFVKNYRVCIFRITNSHRCPKGSDSE